MFLVDTSVWIDFFRGKKNSGVQNFDKILDSGAAYGISGVIFQEVLQGAASTRDFKKLVEYMSTLRFFHPADSSKTYEKAAAIYFSCRQKGITIRSTIDCLIAQLAIENNLTLVHNDKDYDRISKVVKELRLV